MNRISVDVNRNHLAPFGNILSQEQPLPSFSALINSTNLPTPSQSPVLILVSPQINALPCEFISSTSIRDPKRKSTNKKSMSGSPSTKSRKSSSHKWTIEEDELLKKNIKSQPTEEIIWTEVAQKIPNRTAEQCSQRWNRVINPNLKKTPWSLQEEEYIYQFTISGEKPNWAKVAQTLKRTDVQIRYKYLRIIKSVETTWTPEEDQDLLNSLQNSVSWQESSSKLWKLRKYRIKRTPFDCKRRFQELKGADPFSQNHIDISPHSPKRKELSSDDDTFESRFYKKPRYSFSSSCSSSPIDSRMSVSEICNLGKESSSQ